MFRLSRVIGVGLAVGGFSLAIIAGLWLASQVSDGVTLNDIVANAMLAFVPVAFLMGLGLYFYTLSGRESYEESVVYRQRQLLDTLKAHGRISFAELASTLNVTKDDVRDMMQQLIQLQVFSGYVNWSDESLSIAEPYQLQTLTQCAICGYRLPLTKQRRWDCPQCGTQYTVILPEE